MSDITGTPVTITVSGVRRMPRSPNGNPRYIFDTDNGDIYSTAPDTSCAAPRTRARQRLVFWIVAALLVGLLAVPWLAPLFY